MAKKEQILRLRYIEQILRERKNKGASFEEIKHFLQRNFEEKDLKLNFTERTFLRDKANILDIFGIEIAYSRARNIYLSMMKN